MTDEERNLQPALHSGVTRGHGPQAYTPSKFTFGSGFIGRFVRKYREWRSAQAYSDAKDDARGQGIEVWDSQGAVDKCTSLSGITRQKDDASSTVRRRRTNSSEQRQTSAFLGSVATNAVNKLIFGGTAKFEQLQKANRDLEAAYESCGDEIEDTDSTEESRRGSSMPSMHLKPHSRQDTVPEAYTPAFMRIFEPPTDETQAEFNQRPKMQQSNRYRESRSHQTNSSDFYPSSLSDEYASAPEPEDPEPHTPEHRDFSFDPPVDPTLNVILGGRSDEVSNRRSLEDYEAEDAMFDTISLRDITHSTNSSLFDDPFISQQPSFPDYNMTGFYDQPIKLLKHGEHAWQVAPDEPPYSQDSYTASPPTLSRILKTPDRRFPLRRPKHRHSVPNYSHDDIENIPPAEVEEIKPFFTPASARKGSKPRRVRGKAGLPMSPLPNYPALRSYGSDKDKLHIPRKRPSLPKRPPLYRGLDGAGDDQDTKVDKRDFTINDLPSASQSPAINKATPFSNRPKADRRKDDKRKQSTGFYGAAGLMELKASTPLTPSRDPVQSSVSDQPPAAALDSKASPSLSSPSRNRARPRRQTPVAYAEDLPPPLSSATSRIPVPKESKSKGKDKVVAPKVTPAPSSSHRPTLLSLRPPTSTPSHLPPSPTPNSATHHPTPPSPPTSTSPSSIRYASARHHHHTGSPSSEAEFQRQKRRFSGPAEFERQQRRLRRVGTGFPLGFSGFGDNGRRRASEYSDGRAFTPSQGLRRTGDVAEEGEEGEEVMTPMSGGLGEAKQGEGVSG